MTQNQRPASCNHLARTNCSIDIQQSDKDDQIQLKSKGKKRIGRYSFYFQHLIGSGFGGKVYKGIKDNDRSVWYAIKVIKTKDMKVATSQLLKTEISILQELDHPNIVRFVEVLYSNHNCYLITQYCEGGNLEKYSHQKENLQWGTITHQISQGCQYLAEKNIIHRDLKPANIFRKGGIWKIGDFGFARKISHSGALIIEAYKVGSPLFMPLETLERNMYSIKSDSFALGVIIFLLIFKQFPFEGKDIPNIMKNIKKNEPNCSKNQFLPLQVIQTIKGLCDRQNKTRLMLTETDFSIFLTQKSIDEINEELKREFGRKVTDQVILCQFINYLMKNSVSFLEDDHVLYSLMSSNLSHLTDVFGWEKSSSLKQMMKEYILPQGRVNVTEVVYSKILKALESQINILKFREESKQCQVALEKFLEYYQIVRCILHAQTDQLAQILRNITLHQNFNHLEANTERIGSLMASLL